ncbi:MAG: hypothetical protein IT287_07040 [Bdellovibrionaceae bacterium]|nr:hypothetical protein [Pseudobdellovibrionaceae bacterium]
MKTSPLPQRIPKNAFFDIYVGVDQTGATKANGTPKPLVACVLFNKNKKLTHAMISLDALTHTELQKALKRVDVSLKNKKVFICVDSALGLPHTLNIKIRTLILAAKNFSSKNKTHGALTAHAFFNSFLKTRELPQRQVEQLVKANSVFKLKPFQKNIGCETYRILKDLSQDTSWYSLWPFEDAKRNFTIAEGYPSYFWKTLLGAKTRDLEFIKKQTGINFKTVDQADAFMLALGALKFEALVLKKSQNKSTQKEGWILGVPESG